MSFATPEMTGISQPTAMGATSATLNFSQSTNAPLKGVRFPVMSNLPMHANMHSVFSPQKFTNAKHGIEINSYETGEEPAPVTMKFNNRQELEDVLFPTSAKTNVNLDHMHEGMLNHTSAIKSLASSMQDSHLQSKNRHQQLSSEMDLNHSIFHKALGNHTGVIQKLAAKSSQQSEGLLDHRDRIQNLSSEMAVNHNVFHEALENHTGVIRQLTDKTSAQSQGLLDHRSHIETTLNALQQQNLELEEHALKLKDQQSTLSSFRTLLNSHFKTHTDGLMETKKLMRHHANEQDVHATALENHMHVLNKHVGTLDTHATKLEMQSSALEDHRDHIRNANQTLRLHETQMGTFKGNLDTIDTGLVHHTEVLEDMHERQTSSENKMQQMSRQQAQIMQTHANINTNLSKLEACIAKNNAEIKQLTAKTDGAITTKHDIFKIKAAVNENASVLQALYQDLRRDRKA